MLNGKNIKLKALEPSHIDVLCKWENDTRIWKVSNTITPFSRYVMEQYISNSHLDIYTTKQLRLMISNQEEECIGCIDLFDFDPHHGKAGVGILIANDTDRRKGYASEALSLLINYCFEILNLHSIYCNIMVDNEASVKLFQNHHFIIVGTKKEWVRVGDKWMDEHLLQLIRSIVH